MSKLIIQIEDRYISVIQAEISASGTKVSKCRFFAMPWALQQDKKSRPGELADFIRDSAKNAGSKDEELILLFNCELGLFSEYKYKKTSKKMANKRFYVENDNLKKRTGARNITQRLDYPNHREGSNSESALNPSHIYDMSKTAIYGIEDAFFRDLVKQLKKKGLKVVFATSSLVEFYNAVLKNMPVNALSEKYRRLIFIDLTFDCYRAVIIDEGDLIHLKEFPVKQNPKSKSNDAFGVINDFLKEHGLGKEDTLVIVSGIDTERLSWEVKLKTNFYCKMSEKVSEAPVPEPVFAVTGLKINKEKNENYLYGGISKRKFSRATTKICIAAVIALAILFSMLPIYTIYLQNQNEKLVSKMDNYENPAVRDLYYEKQITTSELNSYKNDLAAIEGETVKYSEILNLLDDAFLNDATVNDLIYDEKSGLLINFDISDVKKYENAKNKINDERKVIIAETSRGESASGGKTNIQIKVTIPGQGGGQ